MNLFYIYQRLFQTLLFLLIDGYNILLIYEVHNGPLNQSTFSTR